MVAEKREFFSNICGFQSDVTFISYYPKKNKVVVLLSTMHNNTGSESFGENKLKKKTVLKFYEMRSRYHEAEGSIL